MLEFLGTKTEIENEKLIKFKANSYVIVNAQSHAGKSTFVFYLLIHLKLFESNIKHILYVFGIWQPFLIEWKKKLV